MIIRNSKFHIEFENRKTRTILILNDATRVSYDIYFADELISGLVAYGCPLQLGSANGFIANGDVTKVPIPVTKHNKYINNMIFLRVIKTEISLSII